MRLIFGTAALGLVLCSVSVDRRMERGGSRGVKSRISDDWVARFPQAAKPFGFQHGEWS
jgi:hypothetical protein